MDAVQRQGIHELAKFYNVDTDSVWPCDFFALQL